MGMTTETLTETERHITLQAVIVLIIFLNIILPRNKQI
jgi:hypothetical protein